MKKISKILLPMATTLTAAGAVIPMVCCNKKHDKWDDAVNLMIYQSKLNPYQPEAGKETIDVNQAMDLTFGASNATEIITDDIYRTLSWETSDLSYIIDLAKVLGMTWIGEVRTAQCIIENTQISYDKENHIPKLSGEISLKAKASMLSQEKGAVIGDYILEVNYKISNLPYIMYWTTGDEEWGVKDHFSTNFDINTLKADENWSVVRTWESHCIYDDTGKDEKTNDSFTYDKSNIQETGNLGNLKLICWSSFYLKNCKGNN